jgi:hypothetical protein
MYASKHAIVSGGKGIFTTCVEFFRVSKEMSWVGADAAERSIDA